MGTPTNLRSQIMDPLLNFKFIVNWGESGSGDVSAVAGVSKVSALSRNVDAADYREGASPFVGRKIPGQVKYDNVTLERGIILDVAFEQWANQVWFYEKSGVLGEEVALADFRKTLTIDHCNQAGQVLDRYYVFNCWPSKYAALPELDAGAANAVALESLTLQNEGWQRDDDYRPAPYPSFAEPESPTGGLPPG